MLLACHLSQVIAVHIFCILNYTMKLVWLDLNAICCHTALICSRSCTQNTFKQHEFAFGVQTLIWAVLPQLYRWSEPCWLLLITPRLNIQLFLDKQVLTKIVLVFITYLIYLPFCKAVQVLQHWKGMWSFKILLRLCEKRLVFYGIITYYLC